MNINYFYIKGNPDPRLSRLVKGTVEWNVAGVKADVILSLGLIPRFLPLAFEDALVRGCDVEVIASAIGAREIHYTASFSDTGDDSCQMTFELFTYARFDTRDSAGM